MSVLWRTYLLVTLFFALVTVLGLALLLRQASEDVQREVQAAEAVVEYLYEAAQHDPASLHSGLADNLRHVRVQWLPLATGPAALSLEQWLGQHLFALQHTPRVLKLADGRQLQISVDPTDEIDEVWDSLLQLLLLCLLALLSSLLAIRWAVRRGLRVLDELLAGLQQVTQGQLDARLPARSLPEARQLAGYFNAMATTLQQVQADNTELTQALMALQERERARLGQTLHDDLGQYLSGIRAQACLLQAVAQQPEQVLHTAQQLDANCQRLQEGFRALIRDLYPVVLEHLQLDEALHLLASNWQTAQRVRCHVTVSGTLPNLPLPIKAHLYRLVQEALTNVAKHAQASEVRVRLHYQGQRLRLFIRDNGCGAQLPQRPGIGLRSIHERARSLGGVLRVHSRPQAGWALCLSLVLPESGL
ncbi:HAMP domain-containing sensor histidine kinase [uncultured Pseudomonas sp.]|uniref:sensor histidine kinase n=1 Tax=uncultured Pseudomonas sp. TaxID=114707 RepID=UPI002639E019|nr:HAMP domain-containing sensor histidine kinase [uncultured Pseudomonas sp.]